MNKELISIVIPAYNPPIENFKKCINSIINQSYSNIEVIIVDDGSKADVSKQMDELKEIDSRIKIIHQSNKGEGAARNTGIEAFTGEYLMFVDADDGLYPGWIQYSYELSKKYDADIVAGAVIRVKKIPLKPIEQNYQLEDRFFDKGDFDLLQKDFLYFNSDKINNLKILDPGVCSKLIRKKVVNKLRFPIGIKLSSDQVFNHELLSRAKNYVICNHVSYYYVENLNSISHVYQPQAVEYMMKSMSLIRPFIIDNEDVKQAYYYRVLAEITQAIQYAYFSDKHKISFKEKCRGIKFAMNYNIVENALDDLKIENMPSKQWALKAYLFKRKHYYIYCAFKVMSDYLW